MRFVVGCLLLFSIPLLAQQPQFPPQQEVPPACTQSPDTYALIGLPVLLCSRTADPRPGTVLVAWPLEGNARTGRPRSISVLVEFDAGTIEWWDITYLRIDTDKRRRQREMLMPQTAPQLKPKVVESTEKK